MIVVTGAKGVIGRAVVARLRADGVALHVISRDVFDLSKGDALTSVVQRRPTGVIHLAAAVPGLSSYPDTDEVAAITRRIDKCVFEAARLWDCPTIYASGCSLYNRKNPDLLTEESPISTSLTSPYLQAKADGEQLFMALGKGVIARIAGLIGKGLPQYMVASRFISTAAAGGTIMLWGSGMREQDFVDIEDIAFALTAMLRAPDRSIFNVSTGKPVTMLDFARIVIATLGRGSYAFNNMADPRDGEHARFANVRARELLGWSPTVTLKNSIFSMARTLL